MMNLADELQLMEKDYLIVAMTTMDTLRHNKIPPSFIQYHILNLPLQTIKPKYKKLIETRELLASETSSIRQLFINFSPYCDFLNPDLLEQIVERFGDETSSIFITIYLKKLREFRRRTVLGDMTGAWVALTPPGYVELVLEMDSKWKNKTLEQLESFRSHPSRLQWFLKTVRREGLEVVFSVPQGMWLYQEDLINLQKHDILVVKEGGRDIVDLKSQQCNVRFYVIEIYYVKGLYM